MSFGETIRSLRIEANKTLKEVAEVLDLKLTRLSDVEHCRRGPFSPSRIRKFVQFLGIPEREEELITLASEDSDSVEIKTSSSNAFNQVAFALARKSSMGFEEDDDTWNKILEMLKEKS